MMMCCQLVGSKTRPPYKFDIKDNPGIGDDAGEGAGGDGERAGQINAASL